MQKKNEKKQTYTLFREVLKIKIPTVFPVLRVPSVQIIEGISIDTNKCKYYSHWSGLWSLFTLSTWPPPIKEFEASIKKGGIYCIITDSLNDSDNIMNANPFHRNV